MATSPCFIAHIGYQQYVLASEADLAALMGVAARAIRVERESWQTPYLRATVNAPFVESASITDIDLDAAPKLPPVTEPAPKDEEILF